MKPQLRYLQHLFYELLNDYGRAFLVVRYSENSIIGTRGFTEEEKKKGLVLTFNNRNCKNLQWTEDGSIMATLGFGIHNRPEKCALHFDDIISVFSPDAFVRFDRLDIWDVQNVTRESLSYPSSLSETEISYKEKIVSLDNFRRSKT